MTPNSFNNRREFICRAAWHYSKLSSGFVSDSSASSTEEMHPPDYIGTPSGVCVVVVVNGESSHREVSWNREYLAEVACSASSHREQIASPWAWSASLEFEKLRILEESLRWWNIENNEPPYLKELRQRPNGPLIFNPSHRLRPAGKSPEISAVVVIHRLPRPPPVAVEQAARFMAVSGIE